MSDSELLAADEPAPVRALRETGNSPIVFTCDHADRLMPRRLGRLGLPESDIARHIGWDIGIWQIGTLLSARFDAPLIGQSYSRLVVDCNRRPGVPSSMPEMAELTPVPGNIGLDEEARRRRVEGLFMPYHARITHLLDRRQAAGQPTVLVSLHSFTPVFKGAARPWEIGLLFNRDRRLADILLDLLRARPDLKTPIGVNEPYAVTDDHDYTIPVHGEGRRLPHIAVEIRQDLIGAADGQERWAALFGDVLAKSVGIMREREILRPS